MVQLRFAHLYLVMAVIACCHSAPFDGQKRTPPLLGLLTPAQLHHYNWQLQPDLHESAKRFPKFLRTGRSGVDSIIGEELVGTKDNNVNTGMWFGPRYGRLQKRNQENPWAFIIAADGPLSARQVQYTPRLGRESEELDEDAGVPRAA